MTQSDDNEQVALRREKLAALRDAGNAFPNDFRPNASAAGLHAAHGDQSNDVLESDPNTVRLAGRVMTRRLMGKASFIHLQDASGRIQIYLRRDDLPSGVYEAFKDWDIGDIVGIEGTVFKTKTGELSVRAADARLLVKSLRPLPEKYHGLVDQEQRYRRRYLDLIMNEETRQCFRRRSDIIRYIREYLAVRDFIEVETPMMQPIPGGAIARPFTTHHNALDMRLYLRVAPELYLKRLVVGGFERVFELNRSFRNEGLSTRHNPEFTMVEFYQAYADYRDLMDLTEDLMRGLAREVVGTTSLTYQGAQFDLARPFARLTLKEAVLRFNPDIAPDAFDKRSKAREVARALGVEVSAHDALGTVQFEIFEKTVEHQLIEPTFITEFPVEISPLARKNDHNPFVTDRFELFIGGREIANGFSELNDPEDQAERFREQLKNREGGDDEAMHYDADFIRALEHGLPPTAGEGIGIDRLVMLLTDSPSIRDVLLFPHMRPEHLGD